MQSLKTPYSALWEQIHGTAAELELFEPRLSGLRRELENVAQGEELSKLWLVKATPFLKTEAVLAIALSLNHIAGRCFAEGEKHKAKVACLCALVFTAICQGSEHDDTKNIAENLNRFDTTLRPQLPKLIRFDKPRFPVEPKRF
jgi:hypothetical protein